MCVRGWSQVVTSPSGDHQDGGVRSHSHIRNIHDIYSKKIQEKMVQLFQNPVVWLVQQSAALLYLCIFDIWHFISRLSWCCGVGVGAGRGWGRGWKTDLEVTKRLIRKGTWRHWRSRWLWHVLHPESSSGDDQLRWLNRSVSRTVNGTFLFFFLFWSWRLLLRLLRDLLLFIQKPLHKDSLLQSTGN